MKNTTSKVFLILIILSISACGKDEQQNESATLQSSIDKTKILSDLKIDFSDGDFLNSSGLDARIDNFRRQFRILRRFLRMYSNSEVYRSASRSRCQEVAYMCIL